MAQCSAVARRYFGIPFAPCGSAFQRSNNGDGMDTNKNTHSQGKRQTTSKQASAEEPSEKASPSAASSAMTSVVGTVMQTVATGDAIKSAMDMFAKAVKDLSAGEAKESVVQVKQTFAQAKEAVVHARETFELARASFDTVRETFRNVLTQVRAKPEPFIAAAVPGILGLFLLLRRTRSSSSSRKGRKIQGGRTARSR